MSIINIKDRMNEKRHDAALERARSSVQEILNMIDRDWPTVYISKAIKEIHITLDKENPYHYETRL